MRTLFITNTPLGLPEQATMQYFPTVLAQLGFEIGVVGRTGGNTADFRRAGVQVFEFSHVQTSLYALRKIAQEFRPNLIHVFIHAGCGLYPLVMRTRPGMKFVLDIRSPLLRTGLLRRVVQLKNKAEVLAYDAIGAHSIESAWTVVGKQRYIHWLPPGVALQDILWSAARPSPNPLRAVYIGSLHRSRNSLAMVDAIIQANQQVRVELDIFGQGEDVESIRQRIKNVHLEDRIRVRGLIPRHELYNRLRTYDLGLSYVPKRLYDGAPPLKAAEYLAAGLAVIATNTIGNRMFIENGKNGILTDDTPAKFAEGIIRISSDSLLRRRVAAHARPSIEPFDWKAIVQNNLIPLYKHLLQS